MGLKKKKTHNSWLFLFVFFFSLSSLFFFFYDLHFLCAWENRGQKGKLHSPQGNTVPPALHTASLSGSFLPLLPLFFVCFLCQKQADTSFFFSVRSSFFFSEGTFFPPLFGFFGCTRIAILAFFSCVACFRLRFISSLRYEVLWFLPSSFLCSDS